MGKRSRKDGETVKEVSNGSGKITKSLLVDDKAVDPLLAQLFASSVSFLFSKLHGRKILIIS